MTATCEESARIGSVTAMPPGTGLTAASENAIKNVSMEEDATMELATARLASKENTANKKVASMIVPAMVFAKITLVFVRRTTSESTAR